MDSIHIKGGTPLNGSITISGAKNSALKLMAAGLLCDGELILENAPRLADTRFLGQLLAHLGVGVEEQNGSVLVLDGREIRDTFAPYDLVRKMRASFNVLGPLLAREGKAKVSLPGGCAIGARPVNLHIDAMKALGAEIEIEEGYVIAKTPEGGLQGAHIHFPMVSVGATEHAMLAAVLAKGTTVLDNAAREPEIADLAGCLNAMGAKVSGAGTSTITIEGVPSLTSARWSVVPDRIETGTYAIAAAAAGGEVTLLKTRPDDNRALWDALRRAGVKIETDGTSIHVSRNGTKLTSVDIETSPWPGFATDLQAQFMALMTLAEGTALIRETVFENRFMHAPELSRLGARIDVHGNEAAVRGPVALKGAPVMATDLRASVSLVIAGLAAEGETVVNRVYHLDRGFEHLEDKLSACGANIWRERE